MIVTNMMNNICEKNHLKGTNNNQKNSIMHINLSKSTVRINICTTIVFDIVNKKCGKKSLGRFARVQELLFKI